MIRHLCLEIPNKIGYRRVRLKQKRCWAGFFFKLRYFHFCLAENMIYAYWWLPNILGGAAGWDIRADKKMTCHLRHTYLFLLILMVWPLQSLHENMQMAGLVQREGLPCQYSASNDSSGHDSPNWGQVCMIIPLIASATLFGKGCHISSPLHGEYSYYVVSLQQTAFKRITTFLVSADPDHVSQGICSYLYEESNDTLLLCWYRNLFQDYLGDIHLNVEWL